MRRQPSPADYAGQAKLVQPLGVVIRDASGKDLPLPGIRRNFKSLQLTKDVEQGALALDLGSGRDMLPP